MATLFDINQGNGENGMQRRYLKDYNEGDPISSTLMVIRSQLRTSRDGSFYIDLELGDKSGKMSAKMWRVTREIFDSFGEEDFVQIRGQIETYRDQRQLRVEALAPVQAAHVNLGDFLPCTAQDPEKMLVLVKDAIASVELEPLRLLLQSFFNDAEFVAQFCKAPAAVTYHHPYIGGLLEHTSSMLDMGIKMLDCRTELDHDLLVAGLILHDIGKVEEFSYDRAFRYTDRGKLLGHLVIGADMIRKRAAEIEDFPAELLDLLLHLVLSHHGEYEYGSPRLPMTAEALAVHHIDNLDAKINAFEQIRRNSADPDATWSEYSRMFGRSLYLGNGGAAAES